MMYVPPFKSLGLDRKVIYNVLLSFVFIKESWKNVSWFPQKKLSSMIVFNSYVTWAPNHQTIWFLKDHVTLKTGVMMLKIQLCHY